MQTEEEVEHTKSKRSYFAFDTCVWPYKYSQEKRLSIKE